MRPLHGVPRCRHAHRLRRALHRRGSRDGHRVRRRPLGVAQRRLVQLPAARELKRYSAGSPTRPSFETFTFFEETKMNNPMFFRPTRVLVVENWPDDRGVSVITEDGGEVEWMTDRDDDVPSGYEDLFEELKRKMAKPPEEYDGA